MNYIKLFLIIIASLLTHFSLAQEVLDNIPTRIKWYQVNTPHFRVLYQQDYAEQAQYMANLLETLYLPTAQTLDATPHKIPLLLQNRSSFSNGFVALAPRRSEFYTMPPQDYNFLGTNQWLELLAVHELRHVVQYEKSRTGFTKFASTLLGQQAQSGLANLGVPAWFWEGDAVGIETGLTPSGRGRIPNFNLVFRTQLLEKGAWDYNKQFLRSFQHFVPNHYLTGYYLSTFVRKHDGAEAWSRITEKTFAWPFLPNRFSNQIKKETGNNLDETYQAMVDELKTLWQEEQDNLDITEAERLTTIPEKQFSEYFYPQPHSNGIVTLKTGIGDIATFVNIVPGEKPEEIYIPGIFNDPGQLSVANDKIVWSEYGFNPRWRAVNYSNIKTYDLKSGKQKKLTKRGRYTAPVLSPDGSKIAAVLTTLEQKYYLTILEASNGNVLDQWPTPGENDFIAMPRWSGNGKRIVALQLTDDGKKKVIAFDTTNGTVETLINASSENIGHPVLYQNYLLYNSPLTGIDNIYAKDLTTGENYQVTSRPYAAYNPAVSLDGETLYFNDFSAEGMHVAQMPFNPESWEPISNVKNSEINYHQVWVDQEENPEILENITNNNYPTKRYNRLWHAINPHSWGPVVSTTANELTLGVNSRDILGTTQISGGYEYNAVEQTGNWLAQLSYQALFPIFDISFQNRNRQLITRDDQDNELLVKFQEDRWSLGFRLPLLLTDSRYIQSMNFSAYSEFLIRRSPLAGSIPIEFNEEFRTSNILEYNLRYSSFLKTSKRDIRPKWGGRISTTFKHAPLDNDFNARQYGVDGLLLFPGLVKHHSLLLRGGYQFESNESGIFPLSAAIQYPRGYIYSAFETLFTGSAEYALPLWYPDFHIGKLVNFQRFKTNLFYDFGVGINNDLNNYFNSVGLDFTADVNVFRLLPLLEVGIRTAYVPELNNFRYDLILNYIGY